MWFLVIDTDSVFCLRIIAVPCYSGASVGKIGIPRPPSTILLDLYSGLFCLKTLGKKLSFKIVFNWFNAVLEMWYCFFFYIRQNKNYMNTLK